MAKTDLILLHAPSVYDFRKKPILYGPVSDVIPSTQIFEMYPIGFLTILGYLQQKGHSVRIINVALKMLMNRWFDAERLIRSLKPSAFGLDLHWLAHAQGSLELAGLIKKHHPDIPVIFGGLSASYYHRELISYPQVDYIIRGDSAEEPLHRLLSAIKEGRIPRDVPNLTWKEGTRVMVNPLSHVPPDLDDIPFDYRTVMRSCVKNFDLLGHLPFKTWFSYPIVMALPSHGCINNCTICGGSSSAYRRICGRHAPVYRSPGLVARDMGLIARHINGPIMILGDILQAGNEYACELLSEVKRQKVKNQIAFECFSPPETWFLRMMADTVKNFNIQMSPESHDEKIRQAFGRGYSNKSLEKSIFDALELGCKRIDIFFMIGIPEQTPQSVIETIEYCRELLEKCRKAGHGGKVHPYISPLAPFLDPGSRAFEEPKKYGYKLFCRTLEEHRRALLAPSWKYTLNYETKWMSRDELVDVTYKAALALNRLKLQYGLVSRKQAAKLADRITRELELISKIDDIFTIRDERQRDEYLQELMSGFDGTGSSTICGKTEMNWPPGLIRFSHFRILYSIVTSCRVRR